MGIGTDLDGGYGTEQTPDDPQAEPNHRVETFADAAIGDQRHRSLLLIERFDRAFNSAFRLEMNAGDRKK